MLFTWPCARSQSARPRHRPARTMRIGHTRIHDFNDKDLSKSARKNFLERLPADHARTTPPLSDARHQSTATRTRTNLPEGQSPRAQPLPLYKTSCVRVYTRAHARMHAHAPAHAGSQKPLMPVPERHSSKDSRPVVCARRPPCRARSYLNLCMAPQVQRPG